MCHKHISRSGRWMVILILNILMLDAVLSWVNRGAVLGVLAGISVHMFEFHVEALYSERKLRCGRFRVDETSCWHLCCNIQGSRNPFKCCGLCCFGWSFWKVRLDYPFADCSCQRVVQKQWSEIGVLGYGVLSTVLYSEGVVCSMHSLGYVHFDGVFAALASLKQYLSRSMKPVFNEGTHL